MLKVVPLLFLVQTVSASAAPKSDCVQLIESWRDARDCQNTEAIELLTWPDGFTKWPRLGKGKWSDISMNGPCPKYRTTLREWRPGTVRGNRQIVGVKSITRRVDLEGRYSGDYMVAVLRYTCERRAGRWRIFSEEVTQRVDLINRAAAKQFAQSGGW